MANTYEYLLLVSSCGPHLLPLTGGVSEPQTQELISVVRVGIEWDYLIRLSRQISVFTHFFSTEKARSEELSTFSRYLRWPRKRKAGWGQEVGWGGRE